MGDVPCNGCTLCCKAPIVLHPMAGDDPLTYEAHFVEGAGYVLDSKPDGSCVYRGDFGCKIWGAPASRLPHGRLPRSGALVVGAARPAARRSGDPGRIGAHSMAYPYVYRWNRCGRKGQRCRVTARGALNSCRVEFEDGWIMITSRNAIRKA